MTNALPAIKLLNMDIQVAIGIFFVVIIIVFFLIAFFLPEWVGITGKRAKEITKHQQGDHGPEPKAPDLGEPKS